MRSTLPPAVLAVLVLLGMLATAVWAQGVPAPVSNPNVTVTGSVIATSDGGFGVTVTSPVTVNQPLLVTSDGGLGVTVTTPVVVTQPLIVTSDGGLGVVVRGPLEPLADGGIAVSVFAPDPVRVVGPTNGAVLVSGTIEANLSASSIAALDPAFIYPDLPPAPTLTTTVTTLDDPTITNRSELTVRNLANGNLVLWCCRGASCTPTATAGYILKAGDAFKFDNIRDSDTIRCRAATDPVYVNYIEVAQ